MREADFWTSYKASTLLLRDLNMRKNLQNHHGIPYSKDLVSVSKKGDIQALYAYMSDNLDYDILLADDSMITMNMEGGLVRMVYLQNPIKHIDILEYVSMYHKDDLNVCSVDELREIYKEEYERHLATLELNKAALYIRYDEDPTLYRPMVHPYVHLHIGMNNNIRIPSSVEMTPLTFILFILQQVYYDVWVKEFTGKSSQDNIIMGYAQQDKQIFSLVEGVWKDSERQFLHLAR